MRERTKNRLTKKQLDTLRTLMRYRTIHGSSPSIQDLADIYHVEPSTIFARLRTMREKGVIDYELKKARGITITEKGMTFLKPNRIAFCPVCGYGHINMIKNFKALFECKTCHAKFFYQQCFD